MLARGTGVLDKILCGEPPPPPIPPPLLTFSSRTLLYTTFDKKRYPFHIPFIEIIPFYIFHNTTLQSISTLEAKKHF